LIWKREPNKMSRLRNAPLQEVIFEVRWELEVDERTNHMMDKGFDLAAGALRQILKKEFPEVVRKLPADMPPQLYQFQPVFQFWSGASIWPVIQLGPGILTVNEVDINYDWDSRYFPLVQRVIDWVREAYNMSLKINFVSLKYIDSVDISDYELSNWKDFVNKNLTFNFTNQFDTDSRLNNFSFNQVFEIDYKSKLHLSISNGKNKQNEELLIWQSAVVSDNEESIRDLLNWISFAHTKTSELFRKITKKEFYGSFTTNKK